MDLTSLKRTHRLVVGGYNGDPLQSSGLML